MLRGSVFGQYADAGGSPGTIIEGPINVTGLAAFVSGGSVITANSTLHPYLLEGTPYWLVAYAANADTCAVWNWNSTGDTGTSTNLVFNNIPSPTGPWSPDPGDTRGAFEIDGNPALDTGFQTHYSANLNIGESYIDITNDGANGAALLGPGFGGSTGNICVNVYAFDPNEELVSCCSCLVTPDQTVNLGVVADLTSKTLTGVVPTSVTVKLLASNAGAATCTNSASSVTAASIVPGLAAWGTTLHARGASYATTETPFTASTLSAGELASITGRCASIIGNASGFGICTSCRSGAAGGSKL
jgi:hypothetical protein